VPRASQNGLRSKDDSDDGAARATSHRHTDDLGPRVIDNLPAVVPTIIAEVDAIETFIGNLIDELLGCDDASRTSPEDSSPENPPRRASDGRPRS